MGFEVCDVTKTLGSVAEMVEKGNKVAFDSEGCYILNKQTGKNGNDKEHGGVDLNLTYGTKSKLMQKLGFFPRLP